MKIIKYQAIFACGVFTAWFFSAGYLVHGVIATALGLALIVSVGRES